MTTGIEWIPAADIVIGDAVVEQDGYLWAVIEIAHERGLLVFRLANDFSPVGAWRSTGPGPRFRRRPGTKVAVVRDGGAAVVSVQPAAPAAGEQFAEVVAP